MSADATVNRLFDRIEGLIRENGTLRDSLVYLINARRQGQVPMDAAIRFIETDLAVKGIQLEGLSPEGER